MAKITVISGHPDYQASIANKTLLEEFQKLVPGAEVVKLAELYPDYNIDTAREQQRLASCQTIVLEYPFWWYGAPSLIHRYVEQVFTHGWAYGSQGKALQGKNLVLSFTVGGSEADYQRDGGVRHTIEQFLTGMMATAAFTGMIFRGSVHSFDMACYDPTNTAKKTAIEESARSQAKRLKEHLAQFITLE